MQSDTLMRRRPDIITADLNEEIVMMDIQSGKYFNLKETAAEIWLLLESPLTLHDLVERLVIQYEVSYEQCEKDIMPFLQTMLTNRLILVSE